MHIACHELAVSISATVRLCYTTTNPQHYSDIESLAALCFCFYDLLVASHLSTPLKMGESRFTKDITRGSTCLFFSLFLQR